MFSLVALCVVVAVAHAAADASFSAFQLTLNMALSSKKRQASSCSPAEVMAIQGAAQAVTACLQGVSSTNNTQLCGCYTTYIDDLVGELNCNGISTAITAVNNACDLLSCQTCGSNNTLPACDASQNAAFTAAANVLGTCVQTVTGIYGCKCYEAFMNTTTAIDVCQLGHAARDNVHQVCDSLKCNC